MHESNINKTTDLHTSLYNSLTVEVDTNSFGKLGRAAVVPRVIYRNTTTYT